MMSCMLLKWGILSTCKLEARLDSRLMGNMYPLVQVKGYTDYPYLDDQAAAA